MASSSKKKCSNVQVTVRIKPCKPSSDYKSVISKVAEDSRALKINGELFTFDHIKWGNASQERVYKAVAYSVVEKTLQGYSSIILAYGQTGSGKSYTMGTLLPLLNSWHTTGLIQRCIKHVFEQNAIEVSMSIIEILDEEPHDLLNMGIALEIHKHVAINPKVHNIKTKEEGFQLIKAALELKQEHMLPLNDPQSHTIVTLHLKIPDGETLLESKLNLVDLAGSEIFDQMEAENNPAFVKKGHVNKSLSILNRVITSIPEAKGSVSTVHNNSTLTSVLKGFVDSKSLISLVACMTTHPSDYNNTMKVLHFAERTKNLEIHPLQMNGTTSCTKFTNRLEDTTRQLSTLLSPAGSTVLILDPAEDSVSAASSNYKMKICSVILKKTDENFYRAEMKQDSKENVTPLKPTDMPVKDEQPGLTSVEPLHSLASTVSIGELQTESEYDTSVSTNSTRPKQYQCDTLQGDSCSSSPVDETNAKLHLPTLKTEISAEMQYECPVFDLELLSPILPMQPQSVHQASNVTGGDQGKVGIYHQRGNMIKRMNAVITTDFFAPSNTELHDAGTILERKQINCPSSRKMMKFAENYLQSMLKQDPDSQESNDERSDNDRSDNTQNETKELKYKRMAHSKNILRILNTSTAEQLTALPLIGCKTAITIYQYRLIHGNFRSLKDLENIPIWTKKVRDRFFAANNVFLE
ncbi:kinesin-like protein Nod [Neodiprion pinetum]|uniref:kinesin-like protein Nod n=1 Tax=Neodiprion pinetum TaxID=441929 RepID=UPI001EE0A2ED|nr:kinesin-like protein Nod [Neodiprion pinetum]